MTAPRWWQKNEEIDIVGLNEENKEIYFGEAKWSRKPVGINVLDDLKRKAALVDWNKRKRKEHFMLFSRSSFTYAMVKTAFREGVMLFKSPLIGQHNEREEKQKGT